MGRCRVTNAVRWRMTAEPLDGLPVESTWSVTNVDAAFGLRSAVACGDRLGEGPVWDGTAEALWWLDVKGRFVSCFQPATGLAQRWALPSSPGCIALPAPCLGFDDPIIALPAGLAVFDPQTLALNPFGAEGPVVDEQNRCNDGRVDRQGRLWVGTMDDPEERRSGSLYCVTAAAADIGSARPSVVRWTHQFGDVGVPNSTCFSANGSVMYWADSWDRTIWAFDIDPVEPRITNRRVLATIAGDAVPDGATVDADDHVWCCLWDGWCVVRFRPDGTVERTVPLPVQRPTCPAFGGDDLATLSVTTAQHNLTAQQLRSQPLAGNLLSVDAGSAFGVRGLPEGRFGPVSRPASGTPSSQSINGTTDP